MMNAVRIEGLLLDQFSCTCFVEHKCWFDALCDANVKDWIAKCSGKEISVLSLNHIFSLAAFSVCERNCLCYMLTATGALVARGGSLQRRRRLNDADDYTANLRARKREGKGELRRAVVQ